MEYLSLSWIQIDVATKSLQLANKHVSLPVAPGIRMTCQWKGHMMASTGTARVVNSAFLNEIKECNAQLWEDVTLLGAYAQEPFSGEWIEQNGGALLRRLRDELASQFRMEETYGYVVGTSTHQDIHITRALDQHLSIVLQCVALSEQFDDLEYCGNLSSETLDMWKQMKHLYECIMEHEALERRLVAAAWAPILPETAQVMSSIHS